MSNGTFSMSQLLALEDFTNYSKLKETVNEERKLKIYKSVFLKATQSQCALQLNCMYVPFFLCAHCSLTACTCIRGWYISPTFALYN